MPTTQQDSTVTAGGPTGPDRLPAWRRHARWAGGLVVGLAVVFGAIGALRDGDNARVGGPAVIDAADGADDGAEAASEPRGDAPAESRVAPSAISLQVLDAVRTDGAATAQRLADRMEGDGYDVVVVRTAVRVYDTSVVMYTPGHEAEADRVAAAYGIERVEPKVDNLSDSVEVHVIVGTDRS